MGTSDILSICAIVVSFLAVLYEFLLPARLKWYKPLVFALDDERMGPGYRHRPAIAIALTVYNAGARSKIVWDTAVVVTRLSDSGARAVFQARKFGADLRYVTVPEIEEHARPIEPIVIGGRQTKTVVVQFEQRSNNQWSWRPDRYAATVYSLEKNGHWTERTSFEFTLKDEEMDGRPQSARVTPCQRFTDEVLISRDALIYQSYQRKKSPSCMFWRRSNSS